MREKNTYPLAILGIYNNYARIFKPRRSKSTPRRPAAPRAPRFCKGGHLRRPTESYVSSSADGSLVGGAYSDMACVSLAHKIRWALPAGQSFSGARGAAGRSGATRVASTTFPVLSVRLRIGRARYSATPQNPRPAPLRSGHGPDAVEHLTFYRP